jgi:type I restriction enzyme S subunit
MVNYAASRSEGANLPRLSPKALAEFEIPLPPLEEQKRIAAILDQADALRRLRQRSIERLNSLGQAIFYEMFGECEDLPAEQLQNIAKIDRLGISPEKIANATNYIGLEHIEAGGKILKSVMVTNGDLASTKFQFTPHHVLYGKLRPYLAKIALPNIEGVCSTDILPILPSQRLNRTYLAYYLRLPKMVEYATSRSEGANLPRLSPKALAEFLIPLPSLDNQLSFETKIQEIERQKTQMLDQLVHTDNLFLALQHQAFNGELSGNVYVEHHALRKEASV